MSFSTPSILLINSFPPPVELRVATTKMPFHQPVAQESEDVRILNNEYANFKIFGNEVFNNYVELSQLLDEKFVMPSDCGSCADVLVDYLCRMHHALFRIHQFWPANIRARKLRRELFNTVPLVKELLERLEGRYSMEVPDMNLLNSLYLQLQQLICDPYLFIDKEKFHKCPVPEKPEKPKASKRPREDSSMFDFSFPAQKKGKY